MLPTVSCLNFVPPSLDVYLPISTEIEFRDQIYMECDVQDDKFNIMLFVSN